MPIRQTVKRTPTDKVRLQSPVEVTPVEPFNVTLDGPIDVTSNPNNPIYTSPTQAGADAFGRLRVSTPFAELGLKQLYDGNPLFYDDAETSGSGTTSTYNTNQSSTTLGVADATAGTRIKQSKLRGVYQPGKSFLVLLTGVMGGSESGMTKRIGYYDDNNGLFFQHKDGVLGVVRRTYTSGSVVDNLVAQSSWNMDTLDGTGPSGITLDVTKTNIFVIDFEWLGVGRVRMGVNIDGNTYYCHEFLNANSLSVVYMQNPNLPIRYEISNDGTASDDTLTAICGALISEGGTDDVSKSTYISRGGTGQTLANQDLYTPILSLRMKSGQLSTRINPLNVDVMATTTFNYEWRLYLNPTIAGTDNASWTSITNSSMEYDVSRDNTNTISGGYLIAGGYGSSTNQSKIAIGGTISNFLTLGANIDGTRDEYVLAMANIEGNGGTAYGGLTVGEYF